MPQQAPEWGFSRDVADYFDSCRIKPRLHRDWAVLLRGDNGLEFHIVFQRLAAALVDTSHRGAQLGIRIRRHILRKEVDEPSLTLQQSEHLDRAVETRQLCFGFL